jgi:hypothetical protein
MGERGEADVGQLAGAVAEHPLDRRVGLDGAAVCPHRDDADRGALEQHAESLVGALVGSPHARRYR